MKVSIIVPSYNHKQFIAETISSVLNQSHPDFELIVLDDGSTDGSRELLKQLAEQHQFQLILKENEGICETLNKGLQLATGELITFIASDDTMTPERIIQQVDFLTAHSDIDVVAGAVNLIDTEGQFLSTKIPKLNGPVSFDQIIERNVIFAPTAMFRKRVFERHGLYNMNYAHEDYYMWLKLLKGGGSVFNTDHIWANYRINETNFEKRFVWYYKGNKQALSDYLPDPRVEKRLKKYLVIFCAKMVFLLGKQVYTKYPDELLLLPFHYKFTFRLMTWLPENLRHKILQFLMRNY